MSTATVFQVIKTKEREEFEKVFRQHYALVYRTAFTVTGTAEDAEDVVQTVFLRLYRSGIPPEFENNPKGYLYRAAVNGGVSVCRSRRRQVLTVEPVAPIDIHERSRVDSSTEPSRLMEAMTRLSPRAVEMLILRYEHDFSDTEIARLLGTSRGVVAVTLYRARARLKKLLHASSGGNS